MGDAVGDNLDSEPLGIADRLIPSPSVTHYTRKLEGFGDPPSVVLAIKLYGNIHKVSIAP